MRFAAILFTAGLAVCYAQPPFARGAGSPPDGAPPLDALQTYLGLTTDQLTAFQSIRETTRTAVEPILEQIRTKVMALRDAVKNNDTTTAGQLQVEIQGLRDQIAQIQDNAHAQTLAVLSAGQKDKLTVLEDAAQLQNEVRQAIAAGLIEPPEGAGPGFGRGGFGPGPGRRGPGRFGPPPVN